MAPTTPNQTASPLHSETETEGGLSPSKTSRPRRRLKAQKQLPFRAKQPEPIMAPLEEEFPLESKLSPKRGVSHSRLEITASISSNHMRVAIARQHVELHSAGEVMAQRDIFVEQLALRETEIDVVKARVDQKEMSILEDKQERINFDKKDNTIGKRLVAATEPDSTGSGSTGINGSKKRKSTNPAPPRHDVKKQKPRRKNDALDGLPKTRRI